MPSTRPKSVAITAASIFNICAGTGRPMSVPELPQTAPHLTQDSRGLPRICAGTALRSHTLNTQRDRVMPCCTRRPQSNHCGHCCMRCCGRTYRRKGRVPQRADGMQADRSRDARCTLLVSCTLEYREGVITARLKYSTMTAFISRQVSSWGERSGWSRMYSTSGTMLSIPGTARNTTCARAVSCTKHAT